mmetsp:Transcript_3475/g.9062  ORF Transcript_3475/g.9062 Transcript_3475/m.9062 type:complete len:221 (+) Transcript_3475:2033-2695(+)
MRKDAAALPPRLSGRHEGFRGMDPPSQSGRIDASVDTEAGPQWIPPSRAGWGGVRGNQRHAVQSEGPVRGGGRSRDRHRHHERTSSREGDEEGGGVGESYGGEGRGGEEEAGTGDPGGREDQDREGPRTAPEEEAAEGRGREEEEAGITFHGDACAIAERSTPRRTVEHRPGTGVAARQRSPSNILRRILHVRVRPQHRRRCLVQLPSVRSQRRTARHDR